MFLPFFIERSIEKSLTFHSKKEEGENLKKAFLLKIASEIIIRYEKRVVTCITRTEFSITYLISTFIHLNDPYPTQLINHETSS